MLKVAQLVVRGRIQSRFESVLLITTVCYFKSIPGSSPALFFKIFSLPSEGGIIMPIFTDEKTGFER